MACVLLAEEVFASVSHRQWWVLDIIVLLINSRRPRLKKYFTLWAAEEPALSVSKGGGLPAAASSRMQSCRG